MSSKNLIFGLPFKISKEEAKKAYLQSKGFLEKDLFELNSKLAFLLDIKKKFIPFHSISIQNLNVISTPFFSSFFFSFL
jgi:hypothetical protein